MNAGKVEILLVEDNPNDAELTLRALRRHNLANCVRHLKDGAEVMDLFFPGPGGAEPDPALAPRLILLDLKMPKVDGIEVLRALKSNERTRHIPVVVLTSSREESDLEECYKLGVNSYIVKPVDFDSFIKVVGDLGMYWLLLNQPLK
jgi:two-component system, response regulator